jgi:hypothetical protein
MAEYGDRYSIEQAIAEEALAKDESYLTNAVSLAGTKGAGMMYEAIMRGESQGNMWETLGNMFTGRGQGQDPRLAKQDALYAIFEKYGNPESYEEMVEIANVLRTSGFPDEAALAMKEANEFKNAETNRMNALKSTTSTTDPSIAAQRLLEINAAKWLTNAANKPGYKHNLETWKKQLLGLQKAGYFDTDSYKQLQKLVKDTETTNQAVETSINNDVIKMGTRWVKDANITETEAALVRMEKLIAKYPSDIPGIDWWERNVTAKIMGSVLKFPEGEEGVAVVQALSAITNALLKERSGAAVTESELKRFQKEVQGGFANDAAVRRFISELRAAMDKEKAHIAGGFRPEVRNRYWMQSGYYPTYATPEDVPADLPSGSYYFSPDGILRRKK